MARQRCPSPSAAGDPTNPRRPWMADRTMGSARWAKKAASTADGSTPCSALSPCTYQRIQASRGFLRTGRNVEWDSPHRKPVTSVPGTPSACILARASRTRLSTSLA
eukprot:scaffold25496_cov130-Isochrysis_galbana.AAC.4